MKVAVTGGNGFIGSHVVDHLLDAGHQVVVVDPASIHRNRRAQQVAVSVTDQAALQRAFAGCTAVVHLAGVANVDIAFNAPVETYEVNVVGTAAVCEAARQVGAEHVLLASTVWVYGAADPTAPAPLVEGVPFVAEEAGHVYTSSKIAAELVLQSYRSLYQLDTTILRFGIPYGPRMRDALVLAKFVKAALSGEAITIAGDGSQVRNYLYVSDLADAVRRAVELPAARNTTLALEGVRPVSIKEMAETVIELCGGVSGTKVPLKSVPARPGDYAAREVARDAAREVLGWEATTSFRDGVQAYLDWYRERDDLEKTA